MVKGLLDIARDYFHFVIKFFEVIKLSAPHIYHSALQLSPRFALVRDIYSQWLPWDTEQWLVFGLPDSWDQPMTIDGDYGSYAWSPCGQYLSARESTSVGVWDALTLEKCSTLQLTDPHTTEPWNTQYHSPDVLTYSPDGYSLAGCFGSVFTVWDIQTGGVVKEIECGTANVLPKSLVWSSDGKAIGAIFPVEVETWVVYTYGVTSGVIESTSTLQSSLQPHLWSHSNSLWAMVALKEEGSQTIINILEIWPIPTSNPIKSFSINLNLQNELPIISFSPATYRISALSTGKHPQALLVFDIQSSKVLLQKMDSGCVTNCLSPDGSSLVASSWKSYIYVWKYTSEQNYLIWAEFPFWGSSPTDPRGYQFSPGSLSMLISRDSFLEVQHLDNPETDWPMGRAQYGVFSTDGIYVVTASYDGQIITITNLYEQSSQSINTSFGICGLSITGNILLVVGDNEIVGWRLPVEGEVDEVSDDGEEDCENSIWTKTTSYPCVWFPVEGNIGVVKLSNEHYFYYNTETGEDLGSILAGVPPPSSSWQALYQGNSKFSGDYPSSYQDFVIYDNDSEDDPSTSMPWYQGGWVMYPEGEHQHKLWLPNHWRPDWHKGHWIDNARAIRLDTASGLVIIRL